MKWCGWIGSRYTVPSVEVADGWRAVMDAGLTQRPVYLPDGAQWTNAWTGEVLAGGQTITVAAPLDIIPLFLRDGANLPIR